MRARHSRVLGLLLVALLPALPGTAGAAEKLKIAAMEMKPERGVDPGIAKLLDEVMLADLSERFEVLGKSDINSMLGFEQQKQVLGCSEEASCLAEVGGALGVDFIVSGNLGKVGSLYLVNLKLIDASRAKVVKRVSRNFPGNEERLVQGIKEAVVALMADLKDPAPKHAAQPVADAPAPPAGDATATATVPPPAAKAHAAPPGATAPSPPKRRSNALAWTGVGTGVAAMAAGGAFGLMALDTTNQVVANAKNPMTDGSHLKRDLELRAERSRQANLANALVGGGLAVAVVSFLFVSRTPAGPQPPAVVPVAGPAGIGVGGQLP